LLGLRTLKGFAEGIKYLFGPKGPLFGSSHLRNKAGFFNRGRIRLGWSRYGGKGKSYYHFEYRNGPHTSSKPILNLKIKTTDIK